jgi:hypothetical protein
MADRLVIAFLTDNNVPDSLGNYLRRRGHDVVRVRTVMPADSPDPVIAEAAMRASRVLISWDKDFNHQRFLKPRFRKLSRIGFSCPEVEAVNRLKEVIDLIEFEYGRSGLAKPLLIKVGSDKIQMRR